MDLRRNLEAGGSDDGTGKEVHGKPIIAQDGDAKGPSSLEGGQEMQGEESGGVDRVISVKRSAERGAEQDTEVLLISQGLTRSPHQRRTGKTSTLREDLYSRRPPEGEPLPILAQPISIVEGPPEGEYI